MNTSKVRFDANGGPSRCCSYYENIDGDKPKENNEVVCLETISKEETEGFSFSDRMCRGWVGVNLVALSGEASWKGCAGKLLVRKEQSKNNEDEDVSESISRITKGQVWNSIAELSGLSVL